MLEKIRAVNPGKTIHSICDESFLKYGKIYQDLDIKELAVKVKEKYDIVESGVFYTPSIPEAENTAAASRVSMTVYGGLPIEVGCCCGKNDTLNAFEYHIGSEITYAVTDLVLILGLATDIKDGEYDTKNAEFFFVPKGTVFELYPVALHFAPCSAGPDGFMTVVCLLKGTNTPLPEGTHEKALFMTNKWLICHPDDKEDLEQGAAIGLTGENLRLVIPE